MAQITMTYDVPDPRRRRCEVDTIDLDKAWIRNQAIESSRHGKPPTINRAIREPFRAGARVRARAPSVARRARRS
jgi:hypothetical protein